MSSSPEALRVAPVLRGSAAAAVSTARFDGDLRSHRYLRDDFDPRLLDPTLDTAFVESTAQARAAAEAEGYAAGFAAGRSAAAAEVAAESAIAAARAEALLADRMAAMDRSLAALGAATAALEQRLAPTYAEAADHLGPAAYALVESLLGHELVTRPETVLDAVRRALAAAPSDALVTLHVHPGDVDALSQHPDLTAAVGRAVRVQPDPSVAAGDARASHDGTRVDASLAAAVARVREVLAP